MVQSYNLHPVEVFLIELTTHGNGSFISELSACLVVVIIKSLNINVKLTKAGKYFRLAAYSFLNKLS